MAGAEFIETREHLRFCEFCDACRRYRYIGLCYGPPGVGKTVSARRYADWDKLESFMSYDSVSLSTAEVLGSDTVFYTPEVVHSPRRLADDIHMLRQSLERILELDLDGRIQPKINRIQERKDECSRRYLRTGNWPFEQYVPPYDFEAELEIVLDERKRERKAIKDPTALIIVDEADRLRMAGLEQFRDIFDRSSLGMVLVGMPGLEKRLSRYPQLYSRIGFVHEFRPLAAAQVRELLGDRWCPSEVSLPSDSLADEEGIAMIIRVTGGNFRLLRRLLAQIARVLEINNLTTVTAPVVEAARESLVIGTV